MFCNIVKNLVLHDIMLSVRLIRPKGKQRNYWFLDAGHVLPVMETPRQSSDNESKRHVSLGEWKNIYTNTFVELC